MSQQPGISLGQPKVQRFLTGGFFVVVFLAFTRPLWLVSDFWWHLNTGRWIWDHGRLPTLDPFLFSSGTDLTLRQDMILQGYWLAQLLYYQVWQLSGLYGIVLLKAATLTGMFWLIWRYLRRQQVDPALAVLLTGILVLLTRWFEEPRPQVFSFLGAVVVLLLLETTMEKAGEKGLRRLYALPLVMALWANLHPGYIVGLLLIGAYAIRQLLDAFITREWNRSTVTRLLLYLGSAGASLLNPAGAAPILLLFTGEMAGSAEHIRTNSEYDNLWNYYIQVGEPLLLGLYVFVTALLLMALCCRWRRHDLFVSVLFVSLLIFSFSSFRYSLFFVLLAPLLLARHLRCLTADDQPRLRLFWVGGALLSLLACAGQAKGSVLLGATLDSTRPLDAVIDRLEKLPAGSRVVNPYEWGGYLAWRLTPRQSFFMDARALDTRVYTDYLRLAFEGDKEILEKYAADCLVFYLEKTERNMIPDVVFGLLEDNRWQATYLDDQTIMFVRTAGADGVHRAVVEQLISRYASRLAAGDRPVLAHRTLGRLLLLRGEIAAARQHFATAQELRPADEYARRWLAKLDSTKVTR